MPWEASGDDMQNSIAMKDNLWFYFLFLLKSVVKLAIWFGWGWIDHAQQSKHHRRMMSPELKSCAKQNLHNIYEIS